MQLLRRPPGLCPSCRCLGAPRLARRKLGDGVEKAGQGDGEGHQRCSVVASGPRHQCQRRCRQPQVGGAEAGRPGAPVRLTAGSVVGLGGVMEWALAGGLAGAGADVEHVGRRVGDVGRS